ncbi:MAG TPA: hypothetical protein VHX65_00655 [Pirellulales bacterium]|nr:hypothetical protein [Pirellulales bacterium]
MRDSCVTRRTPPQEDHCIPQLKGFPRVSLSWDEIQAQLAKWEVKLLEDRGP